MSSSALLQYVAFLLAVTLLVKPVGRYMARVFSGEKTLLDPLLCPVERLIYRLTECSKNRRWVGRSMRERLLFSGWLAHCFCTRSCACSDFYPGSIPLT